MEKRAATYRIPERTADRLAQASYRTGKAKATIVAEALDHWLTSPRRPGCPDMALAATVASVAVAATRREVAS